MSTFTMTRPASLPEMAKEMDRRGDVIVALEAEIEALRSALHDIATDEREHGDDELATYYRMKETAERALNGEYTVSPVAVVINDNQPGKTAIIEITVDPPTLEVGMKLYARKAGVK